MQEYRARMDLTFVSRVARLCVLIGPLTVGCGDGTIEKESRVLNSLRLGRVGRCQLGTTTAALVRIDQTATFEIGGVEQEFTSVCDETTSGPFGCGESCVESQAWHERFSERNVDVSDPKVSCNAADCVVRITDDRRVSVSKATPGTVVVAVSAIIDGQTHAEQGILEFADFTEGHESKKSCIEP